MRYILVIILGSALGIVSTLTLNTFITSNMYRIGSTTGVSFYYQGTVISNDPQNRIMLIRAKIRNLPVADPVRIVYDKKTNWFRGDIKHTQDTLTSVTLRDIGASTLPLKGSRVTIQTARSTQGTRLNSIHATDIVVYINSE